MFLAAEAAVFLAVGVASWPLLAAWGLGALVVQLVALRVRGRWQRVLLAGLLPPGCVLLVFEGGLFFLPAAMMVFVAASRTTGVKTG
jgi:hypothetical protein